MVIFLFSKSLQYLLFHTPQSPSFDNIYHHLMLTTSLNQIRKKEGNIFQLKMASMTQ